jgi:L-fucono-1,5-lactonase
MTLDAHQHFWRYNAARDGWITDEMAAIRRDFLPEHLAPELRAHEVEGTVAVQADQSEEETRFLLDLAEHHPLIRGVVGWVDLRSARVAERLEFFSEFPRLRGFRHIVQSEPDDRFLLRPDFLRGIGALRQFGFTYDLLVYPHQLPAAVELVAKFPAQKFVLDHIAKPPIKSHEIADWEASIRQLAAQPNVYCKLSGLVTEADWKCWRAEDFRPYLDVVFDCFGAERLMFGSDWPVCLLAASYGQVKQLIADYTKGLPQADRDKIFGLNAGRFYGLTA